MSNVDLDDLCVWPCGDWCRMEDIEEYMASPCAKSDDYKVLPWDSVEAAWHTGALEDACKIVLGTEYWQVINAADQAKVCAYLGIPVANVTGDRDTHPAGLGDTINLLGKCLFNPTMDKYHMEAEVLACAIKQLAPKATLAEIDNALRYGEDEWDVRTTSEAEYRGHDYR